jgi:3-hydroxyisobutyrate dehydrogenase-like beta-hydroxyacid dehydrogenase
MAEQGRSTIGFIGFGEVAATLSRRMKEMGGEIVAYDTFPDTIQEKAGKVGIPLETTLQALVNSSRLILSCVWPDVALDAAKETAPFLSPATIFCDMNSISPETTVEIEQIISGSGAGFVKIAIMAGIPDRGHKVPLLAAGAQAREVTELLSSLGLIIENVGSDPRHPAAMKILRSVCLKGVVALAYEMLMGAEKYGIVDQILDSSSEVMGKASFRDVIDAWISSTAIHARRRANEMEEVVSTLRTAGIDPIMSIATKQVFEKIADLGLDKVFQGQIPDSFHRVLEIANEHKSPPRGD